AVTYWRPPQRKNSPVCRCTSSIPPKNRRCMVPGKVMNSIFLSLSSLLIQKPPLSGMRDNLTADPMYWDLLRRHLLQGAKRFVQPVDCSDKRLKEILPAAVTDRPLRKRGETAAVHQQIAQSIHDAGKVVAADVDLPTADPPQIRTDVPTFFSEHTADVARILVVTKRSVDGLEPGADHGQSTLDGV